MKLLNLEKDYSIKLSSNIVDFIYPDYVFIPMYNEYKLIVKNKEEIKKEQVLLKGENKNFYSPVSGRVVGAKNCVLCNGEIQKCLVIENDFKEKMIDRKNMRKNLLQISKNEFLNILNEKSLFCSQDITELLIDKFENKNFKNIVLVGIEEEPYLASKIFALSLYSSEILETISFLARILETNSNIVILKENDRDNVEKYTNTLGTYPEIALSIVPDLYPIGNDDVLIKYIGFNKDETLIMDVNDILTIYNVMKKNKLITEKLITISGNAIENPIVVRVKLGSSVKSIIDEHINFLSNDEVIYAVNGLMRGKALDITDLIVTNDLEGIIIDYKRVFLEHECINCGKCSEVCPVNIDPKQIFYEHQVDTDKQKCINCGLCTYICPSYINFKKRIEEFKNEE